MSVSRCWPPGARASAPGRRALDPPVPSNGVKCYISCSHCIVCNMLQFSKFKIIEIALHVGEKRYTVVTVFQKNIASLLSARYGCTVEQFHRRCKAEYIVPCKKNSHLSDWRKLSVTVWVMLSGWKLVKHIRSAVDLHQMNWRFSSFFQCFSYFSLCFLFLNTFLPILSIFRDVITKNIVITD